MTKKSLVSTDLIRNIISSSGNELADTLKDSQIVNNKDFFTTAIPALNIALSGDIHGGMQPGILQIVGESKSFKTLFMLTIVKAYLDKYPDSVFVFFDSEFGAAKEYFDSLGIDSSRVIHLPIKSVEDLRGQINKILDNLQRGVKLIFGVDSIGLLPSNKEVDDAVSGNAAADMTRARVMNSLFRTLSTQLVPLDIPMVVVNHYYDSIGGFISKKIVKGGQNAYLVSDIIWMITRAQEKEKTGDKELVGYKFTIWIEKSRKVKEKVHIPIVVRFDGGIDKYTGLEDIAVEGGFIKNVTTKEYKFGSETCKTTDKEIIDGWLEKLLNDEAFADYVRKTYRQVGKQLIKDETIQKE